MIQKGYPLRFCQSHQDTDRCISQDDFPSRIETQRALEKSNFTLLLRGDTPGGDRWFQAMTAGTVLIQVIESEKTWDWLPFPCAVPWRDMVLSIQRDSFMQEFLKSSAKQGSSARWLSPIGRCLRLVKERADGHMCEWFLVAGAAAVEAGISQFHRRGGPGGRAA